MKNTIKVLLIGFILVASGCKEFFDINDDPNNPLDATVDLILPSAQTSMAVTIGGSYHNLGGFWAQYYTQSPDAGQYEEFDEYNVSSDEFDREWQEAYAGALNDMEIIRSKATESEDNSYYLIATLMQCYLYQMLADLYGDIPFTEALQGATTGNLNPTFDNGKDIYPVLISRIDEAVDRYANNDPGLAPGARDLIYDGVMSDWLRFANTLKLKLYLRTAYVAPNQAAVNALLTENFFLTKNAKIDEFVNEQGKRNPYYEIQIDRLGDVNQSASNTLLKYLIENSDPRLDKIYSPGANGHLAKEQGDFANRDVPNGNLSTPNITALTPVYFITVSETQFLIAEALVRYAGSTGAQAAYEAAIDASFAMHGLSGASALYGSGGAYEWKDTSDMEYQIKVIMMQKWVAMANFQNLEAFFEINRTKYPPFSTNAFQTPGGVGELTISYGSVWKDSRTPKRLLIPDIEIARNSSANAQPSEGLAKKIWWDTK